VRLRAGLRERKKKERESERREKTAMENQLPARRGENALWRRGWLSAGEVARSWGETGNERTERGAPRVTNKSTVRGPWGENLRAKALTLGGRGGSVTEIISRDGGKTAAGGREGEKQTRQFGVSGSHAMR